MPRYHFLTSDGVVHLDPEGMQLADIDAARREAVMFAGECLRDEAQTFVDERRFDVTVSDDDGLALFTISIVMRESRSADAA